MSCCFAHSSQWEFVDCEFLEINLLTFAVMPHIYKSYHQPVHQLFSARQLCWHTHTHALTVHVAAVSALRLGHIKACDIDRVLFYLTTIASLWDFFPHWPQGWMCLPVLAPSLSALSLMHYSEVIYNACGVMVPSYPSSLIIKQASSRGLWPLPIPPPYHPPRTKHKTERKGDCIYRRREKERSKGTERESYRFNWTTLLFSRSTGEISLKGCCSLSIGLQGWILWSQGWREKERGGGIHAERETQRHSSIQLCSRRIRVSERTARNKSRETWHSQNVEPVDVLCDIEIFLCWSTISVAMSCVEPCSVSKKGRKENSTDKKQ